MSKNIERQKPDQQMLRDAVKTTKAGQSHQLIKLCGIWEPLCQ